MRVRTVLCLALPRLALSCRLHTLPNRYHMSSPAADASPVPVPHPVAGDPGVATDFPPVAPGEKTITEGTTTIVYGAHNECFYNKVQVLNRDLSILAINTFDALRRKELTPKDLRKQFANRQKAEGKPVPAPDAYPEDLQPEGLRILEALAATGLRSIRYSKEIPGVARILCNDIDPSAVESIRKNAALNGVDPEVLVPHQGDANVAMYLNKTTPFHVVDLDPYGTAAPFLDAAVQCVTNGGLLCVTCTDLTALCGNHLEACYPKYGSVPLKARFCHEGALRIVLACVDKHANTHGRYVEPLLCVQMDFYVRLFVRVYDSTEHNMYASPTRLSYVYQCLTCESHQLQPLCVLSPSSTKKSIRTVAATGPAVPPNCPECGGKWKVGGPLWHDPLHDSSFIDAMLSAMETGGGLSPHPAALPPSDTGSNTATHVAHSRRRMVEILKACKYELPNAPLYVCPSAIASTIRCQNIPNKSLYSAILNAGYKYSQSHVKAEFVKTTAPYHFLWDVLRVWERTHPVADALKKDPEHTAHKILSKPVTSDVDFTPNAGVDAVPRSKFVSNPDENWGPKARAVGKAGKRDRAAATAEAAAEEKEEEKEEEEAPAPKK